MQAQALERIAAAAGIAFALSAANDGEVDDVSLVLTKKT
jgi:hypothetical protein